MILPLKDDVHVVNFVCEVEQLVLSDCILLTISEIYSMILPLKDDVHVVSALSLSLSVCVCVCVCVRVCVFFSTMSCV